MRELELLEDQSSKMEENGGKREPCTTTTADESEYDEEKIDDNVIVILQEASRNVVDKVELSRLQLKFLPEAFWKLHHLVRLNLSQNQLEVALIQSQFCFNICYRFSLFFFHKNIYVRTYILLIPDSR